MSLPSLRSMRQRVWSALLLSSDQEIHDGLAFYPGAHGLCRFFSRIYSTPEHPLPPRSIAGIYAALSPLNTWDTNVSNILDVLRNWSAASVNTTDANLHKALRIRCGEDPETVLSGGPKVLSFFRCLADPTDLSLPPAIDRHLINLALGLQAPTKREQADHAHDRDLYSRVEQVYQDLGSREGLGNRLASIAWFVQRRMSRHGQHAHHLGASHSALVCCGRPMQSHGRAHPAPGSARRWYCPTCCSSRVPEYCLRLVRTPSGWTQQLGTQGLKVWRNKKGRACVTLPLSHPYSNSAGYQYLARFLISESLGYLPDPMTHTHHEDKDLRHDLPLSNLSLVNVVYHGQIHASAAFVARGEDGRFRELEPDQDSALGGIVKWPRAGAVLGNQAQKG